MQSFGYGQDVTKPRQRDCIANTAQLEEEDPTFNMGSAME
jgi:hypothetical protein